jgi:hypothetical protein
VTLLCLSGVRQDNADQKVIEPELRALAVEPREQIDDVRAN